MEPDEQQSNYNIFRPSARIGFSTERNGGFVPIIPRYTRAPRIIKQDPEVLVNFGENKNPLSSAQQFLPYYRNAPAQAPPSSPPSGHSRPFARKSSAATIAGRYSISRNYDPSILGSGDFDVIQGGTFYPEGEGKPKYNDHYKSGSGTNKYRPNSAPFRGPRPYYPEDPFANFRDFADINAGSDPAFSHFVVVYANKNGTKPHPNNSPKNIFEQLQLLDQEKEQEAQVQDDTYNKEKYSKKTKLSKFKTKLAATKMEKKYKKKSSPKESLDYVDPLMAES